MSVNCYRYDSWVKPADHQPENDKFKTELDIKKKKIWGQKRNHESFYSVRNPLIEEKK